MEGTIKNAKGVYLKKMVESSYHEAVESYEVYLHLFDVPPKKWSWN